MIERSVDRQLQAAMRGEELSGRIAPDKKAVVAGAAAELDARDPDFIRRQLALMWLLTTLYFRAEVR